MSDQRVRGLGPDQPQYVRFPPRWRNVLIPVRPRSAAAVGLSLYTASRPAAVLAQLGVWTAVRLAGTRVLPGPREQWAPAIDPDEFAELRRAWEELAGGRSDGLAVYERLQPDRAALTLMVCAGARSLLVRVRTDPSELDLERRLSAAANRDGPLSFRVPRLAGSGVVGQWHWVAYAAMGRRPHRPVRTCPDELPAQVSTLVESVIERPAGVPAHWRGAHADLTPWNLRRGGRSTWLIDWEDAGWAPPGADALYYRSIVAALKPPSGPLVLREQEQEAADYWAAIIERRPIAATEEQLRSRLLELLRR